MNKKVKLAIGGIAVTYWCLTNYIWLKKLQQAEKELDDQKKLTVAYRTMSKNLLLQMPASPVRNDILTNLEIAELKDNL